IVIDDAVVVLENIFRFIEEKGLSPREAAAQGTGEITLAVLATTLSLIAVFLPVAFTLTPMLCSRWIRANEAKKANGEKAKESTRERGFYARIEKSYLWLLDHSLAHRWVVVLVMLAVFVSTIPLFQRVDKNFLPRDDESQFGVNVRAPEGSSLATTQTIVESIANRIRKFPEVAATVVTIGDDPQVTKNLGQVYVRL